MRHARVQPIVGGNPAEKDKSLIERLERYVVPHSVQRRQQGSKPKAICTSQIRA